MTKKIYLETLKSVLGQSISHYCGCVGVRDSSMFKTLISSLISATVEKYNTFVDIRSKVCDVGPGSFLRVLVAKLSMSCDSCFFRMLASIYQNVSSNYLYFFSCLLLIFLYILLEVTVVVCC